MAFDVLDDADLDFELNRANNFRIRMFFEWFFNIILSLKHMLLSGSCFCLFVCLFVCSVRFAEQ